MRAAPNSTPFPARLLAAALIGGALLLIAPRIPPPSPVYSVAAVRAGLAHSPRAWVGRVVSVRAIAYGCWVLAGPGNATCRVWRPGLIDTIGQTDALALTWAKPIPLLAALHRLPLIGTLLPAPQVTRWDVSAVYRIHLQAAPCPGLRGRSCFAAVLLDAVPDSV